jgi:hypothetical protein
VQTRDKKESLIGGYDTLLSGGTVTSPARADVYIGLTNHIVSFQRSPWESVDRATMSVTPAVSEQRCKKNILYFTPSMGDMIQDL